MKIKYFFGVGFCLLFLFGGCGKDGKTALETKIPEQQNKAQLLKAYNVCKETYDNIFTIDFQNKHPLETYNWVNFYKAQKRKLEEAIALVNSTPETEELIKKLFVFMNELGMTAYNWTEQKTKFNDETNKNWKVSMQNTIQRGKEIEDALKKMGLVVSAVDY